MNTQAIVIKQVKQLLKDSFKRFAVKHKCDIKDLVVLIYSDDSKDGPRLKLSVKSANQIDIEFKDLYTTFQYMMYKSGFGFDISKQLPEWVWKFMLKSCTDHNINLKDAFYMMAVRNNDVAVKMQFNSGDKKEIPVEYILETR